MEALIASIQAEGWSGSVDFGPEGLCTAYVHIRDAKRRMFLAEAATPELALRAALNKAHLRIVQDLTEKMEAA